MIESKIENDLKKAMLAQDKSLISALRNIKATILNKKIELNNRADVLDDKIIIELLSKEAKKRQDSADLYIQGDRPEKADAEIYEKKIIEGYLPEQLSSKELEEIIDKEISLQGKDIAKLGSIIQAIKLKTLGQADLSSIAKIIKEKLTK